MKKNVSRLLCVVLALMIILSAVPSVAAAYTMGEPYKVDLSGQIDNVEDRLYVQMMIDYYFRNDTSVQEALKEGLSAVFMFEGCSDNMDDSKLSDISYYRVSGLLIVLKLDSNGYPYVTYFSEDCSSIPDRPLEYGAWWLDGAAVGPATICDGTYQLYSTYHLGQYEALNVRDSRDDYNVAAVYMSHDGFEVDTANGINIHTRNSNHISGGGMWSEGCQLVGDGNFSDFTEFMSATYYTAYRKFAVEKKVGTFTLNRYCLREELQSLYGSAEAVDILLADSIAELPAAYLEECSNGMCFNESIVMCTTTSTSLMTLPCSNSTDARSLCLTTLSEGSELKVEGSIYNSAGNLWYEVNYYGETCYVYGGNVKEVVEDSNWFFRFWG